MFRLLLIILCFGNFSCRAQVLRQSLPMAYTSALTYSRQQSDAFSFHSNPAVLAFVQQPSFGFSGEQPFLIPELSAGTFSAALPLGNSRLGLQLRHMGGSMQHQSGGGLSFAQVLGKRASVGANFYYQSVAVAGYKPVGMLGVGLGGSLQFTDILQGGFRLFQSAAVFGNKNEGHMAAQYELGLGCDLSSALFIAATLAKREGVPPEVQAACSYLFAPKLHSRLGVHTGTGLFFFGGGFRLGALQVDAFTSLHPRLGFSPGLQVLYKPAEKP